jgi:ubiquinone/menaquinone biosynthesis C-methylase UbiE
MRTKWDIDPLQEAMNHGLKSQGLVIGDFGCGTAKLAEQLRDRHVVHSFDHVAINDKVTACDIADRVPLPDGSLDLAIFSLSLMGPNWKDQLVEARRCLKPTGQVLIWTASSGKDAAEFSIIVESTGFKVVTSQSHYKWLHVWAVCI